MTKRFMCRQGDVLVQAVDAIPGDAVEQKRDDGKRIVLAYGEVTGHAHAILDRHATLKQTAAGRVFLQILDEAASLVHEEHTAIKLPPGNYEVLRQREYSPEQIRQVAD